VAPAGASELTRRAVPAGDDRWGGAPSMAEIAEMVAAMTPSDTSIRLPTTVMLAPSSPKRTLTPAATKEQPPPLARLKNLSPAGTLSLRIRRSALSLIALARQ
jgi:hypothetical protein